MALASRPRLSPTVLVLGLTSLFNDIGSEMIFPLLPVFVVSLGASPTFLGLVEGVADATASLLKLVAGYLSDRLGRHKPLVLFGYGLATVVRPLVALATAPWQVLTVRVADRVGKGIRGAPRDAMIAGAVPVEHAGRAFGFHRAMDHAGAVIGPVVATVLLAAGIPLRSVFLIAIVPGALAIVALFGARDTPAASDPKEDSATEVVFSSSLRRYFAVLALFCLGNSSDAFLLLRARELGVSVKLLPLLWSALHVSKMISAYIGGGWADRYPKVRVVVAGWLVYGATYLAFGFATSPSQVWALFVVYGCYYGLSEPAEKALVNELAPAHARGRAYGAYNFIVGISAVPAGVLTGWLWRAVGPRGALTTGAGIAVGSSCALILWARAEERRLSRA